MNLNFGTVYTYLVTYRESCIEIIFCKDILYFERKHTNIFSWPNSRSEAVLITDELHFKL